MTTSKVTTTTYRWAVVALIGLTILVIINHASDILSFDNDLVSYNRSVHGDLVKLCKYKHCKYIQDIDGIYRLSKDRYGLVAVKSDIISNSNILSRIRITEHYLPSSGITIYSNGVMCMLNRVSLSGLPIIVIMLIIVGYLSERRALADADLRIVELMDNSSLERDLKGFVAATAHHEMLTPIAVMRSTINRLIAAISEDRRLSGHRKELVILDTTITRLESVLNQMSSERNIRRSNQVPILDSITTTIESLHVLYIELNFVEDIANKELLNSLRSYKLESGMLCNILNNLFKNSLEAGANRICVIPELNNDMLSLYIVDNGSGIHLPGNLPPNEVFTLGCTHKEEIPNIIEVTKKLNSDNVSRGNGLPLVKAILTNTNGRIELVKTTESGTVFKLEIPVKPIEGDTCGNQS